MATTTTMFDIAALKQALESLDLNALREMYADDVEHLSIDEKTPPSAPGVRNKERLMSAFEHCKGADGRITVENEFAGEDRAAATLTCSFPSGFPSHDELDLLPARGQDHAGDRHPGVRPTGKLGLSTR